MEVKEYDSSQVSVIVGTRAMKGFAEGEFVTVVRDEQAFQKKVGADGEVTRSKTNNKAGAITIILDQASESNDYLSGLELSGEIVPVTIRDGSGRSLCFARQAWIQKVADNSYGRDAADRTWVLDCGPIDMFIAGN